MSLVDFSNVTGSSSSTAADAPSSPMSVDFWTGVWATLTAAPPTPAPAAAAAQRPDFSNVTGSSSSTAPAPSSARVPGWVVYAAGGAAVAIAGYLLLRRRRRR